MENKHENTLKFFQSADLSVKVPICLKSGADMSWCRFVLVPICLAFFGLTYHIVLKNDTLFVPSGQSPRFECHSFKLIAVLSCQIDVPYVYKPLAMMNFRECFKVNF